MFSSECPLWHVSRACHPLYLFPRLPPVEAFPRWKCVTCFPAISTRYMFSRACHPLPVCPRLPPVACAVTKASYINFQLAYCTIRCCSDLRRENFDLLLQEFFNCSASHHPVSFISLTLSNLILSVASLTRIKQLSGRNTSSIYSETCQTSLTGQTCHDTVWSIRTNQCKTS